MVDRKPEAKRAAQTNSLRGQSMSIHWKRRSLRSGTDVRVERGRDNFDFLPTSSDGKGGKVHSVANHVLRIAVVHSDSKTSNNLQVPLHVQVAITQGASFHLVHKKYRFSRIQKRHVMSLPPTSPNSQHPLA